MRVSPAVRGYATGIWGGGRRQARRYTPSRARHHGGSPPRKFAGGIYRTRPVSEVVPSGVNRG